MKKEVKKSIDYYKKYMKQFECQNNVDNEKGEKSDGAKRTDCFEHSVIAKVTIYDVLSNEGVSKLLKKLYSLSKRKFKVRNHYKKPTRRKGFDYIHLQYSHTSSSLFAEIELLKDKYIKEIIISWSQINSYFALIEYNFRLKKRLDDNGYNQFVYENISKLSSKDYVAWYHVAEDKKDWLLQQMQDEYFILIFQHYITSFLYTEQGKKSRLTNLVYQTRKEPIDMGKLYLDEMGASYYNKKQKYVICSSALNDIDYCLLSGNNLIPQFSICPFISKYGNEFYYRFFGYRELKAFEIEFSRFFTGRKKIDYNEKLKRLLTKMQSVAESENRNNKKFFKKFNKSWDFYINYKKSKIKDYPVYSTDKIKEIYQDNFSYLKLLVEMKYTKSNRRISIVAVLISIIATIISVISLLKDDCGSLVYFYNFFI
ncbi:MAG: hypothetical protein HFG38_05675 [Eubacterium sp.]|nr:hypothetical protein [Eubacterium sp.]